ncbi:hypothetical protein D3C87_1332800 [compost metagenome]
MRNQIAGRFPRESRTGIECAELLHLLRRQWTVLGNGSVENDGGAAAKGTGRPAVRPQLDQTGLTLIERANGAFKRRRARLERGEEIAAERHDRLVETAFAPVKRQRNVGVNLLSQFDELRVDIFHALQRCLKLRVFKRRRLREECRHGGIHLLACGLHAGDAARRFRRIERQCRGAVAAFTAEIQKSVEKKLVERDELRNL